MSGLPRLEKILKNLLVPAGLFGALVLYPSPAPLHAQAVKYTDVSRGEFGGMLGMLMEMAPGADEEIRETVYIKGSLMRTDHEETSTITDMATGRYTLLNHEDRTWFTMDMAEMMAQFQGMEGEWEEEAPEETPEEAPEEEMPEVEVRVTTDRTGRTQRFDGYTAEQVFMTMEVIPVTQEARASAEETGNMVVFTELWLSEDFPGMEALEEARAEFTREGVSDQGAGGYNAALQEAFAQDPRLRGAMEKNMEEMEELRGIPVKTVTSMVLVPLGQEFDAEAVAAASDQPLQSGGMGDLMGQAAGAAAADAAREALGRMGGMFGRGKKKEEAPPEAAAGQAVFMRITSLLEDVQTSDIPDSVFEPPADYQEQEPAWRGGGRDR